VERVAATISRDNNRIFVRMDLRAGHLTDKSPKSVRGGINGLPGTLDFPILSLEIGSRRESARFVKIYRLD